jgi:hypothetical protein
MAATLTKRYRRDTGAELWFIYTDEGYETFIEWGLDGPGGRSSVFMTREPDGVWITHKPKGATA